MGPPQVGAKKRTLSEEEKRLARLDVRLVCFTHFGDTEDAYPEPLTTLHESIQYYCYGKETCPTTGRLHHQGFAYGEKMKLATWSKRLELIGHGKVLPCNGNLQQNEVYCSKQGLYTELGVAPMGDGKKRCLQQFTDAIMRNPQHPINFVAEEPQLAPLYVQYGRGLTDLASRMKMRQMNTEGYKKREIYILVGKPGTGKSRYVYEHHLPNDIYTMPTVTGQWYGSYAGQPVVVFNDVCNGSVLSISDFLNITDGYPIEVPVKGGFVPWCAQTVYFTSNHHWTHWWDKLTPEHRLAVERRLTAVISI
jgi:hypothetical protein